MSRVSKHSGLIAWGRGEDGQIDALSKDKGERLFTIIREGIDGTKKVAVAQSSSTIVKQQISIADELTKLAILKQQGIISEIEFAQLKQDSLEKNARIVTGTHSENKSISSFDKHIAY